jgi:hypothetical protein
LHQRIKIFRSGYLVTRFGVFNLSMLLFKRRGSGFAAA